MSDEQSQTVEVDANGLDDRQRSLAVAALTFARGSATRDLDRQIELHGAINALRDGRLLSSREARDLVGVLKNCAERSQSPEQIEAMCDLAGELQAKISDGVFPNRPTDSLTRSRSSIAAPSNGISRPAYPSSSYNSSGYRSSGYSSYGLRATEAELDCRFLIEPEVAQRFNVYADAAFPNEIGGMLRVVQDDNGDWRAIDLKVFKQQVSAAYFELDGTEVAKFNMELHRAGRTAEIGEWRSLIHSHPEMTPFMSGVDRSNVEQLAGPEGFAFSVIASVQRDPERNYYAVHYAQGRPLKTLIANMRPQPAGGGRLAGVDLIAEAERNEIHAEVSELCSRFRTITTSGPSQFNHPIDSAPSGWDDADDRPLLSTVGLLFDCGSLTDEEYQLSDDAIAHCLGDYEPDGDTTDVDADAEAQTTPETAAADEADENADNGDDRALGPDVPLQEIEHLRVLIDTNQHLSHTESDLFRNVLVTYRDALDDDAQEDQAANVETIDRIIGRLDYVLDDEDEFEPTVKLDGLAGSELLAEVLEADLTCEDVFDALTSEDGLTESQVDEAIWACQDAADAEQAGSERASQLLALVSELESARDEFRWVDEEADPESAAAADLTADLASPPRAEGLALEDRVPAPGAGHPALLSGLSRPLKPWIAAEPRLVMPRFSDQTQRAVVKLLLAQLRERSSVTVTGMLSAVQSGQTLASKDMAALGGLVEQHLHDSGDELSDQDRASLTEAAGMIAARVS